MTSDKEPCCLRDILVIERVAKWHEESAGETKLLAKDFHNRIAKDLRTILRVQKGRRR